MVNDGISRPLGGAWVPRSGYDRAGAIDVNGTYDDGTFINPTFEGALTLPGVFLNVQAFPYLAVGDGITDDTAAFAAALAALDGIGGIVFVPVGLYKITSGLTIPSGVSLIGASQHTAALIFAPTGAATLLKASAGAELSYSGAIKDLRLYAQDTTYTKVAIELVDADSWLVERVIITGNTSAGGTFYWGGNGSIGLRTKGRDLCAFAQIYIAADKPLVIAENPNHAIDIDHFHFHDLTLVGNGHPLVTIETGVNLTHVVFDGYQAWVKGTAGLSWQDTTSVTTSAELTLRNVRHEQGESATGYLLDIAHNTNLHGLVIDGLYGGLHMRGIKLRKVKWATVQNYEYVDASKEALNIDNTVDPITFISSWAQTGATATLTSVVKQIEIDGSPSVIPLFAVYGAGDSETQGTIMQKFGGSTSAFPMWKRVSTILQAKLADDSALTAFQAGGNCGLAADSTPQAGGNVGHRVTLSNVAGLGVYFGSGLPTVSAAQGSLYIRTDGTTTNDRLYVNTNGTTGWTAVVTAS